MRDRRVSRVVFILIHSWRLKFHSRSSNGSASNSARAWRAPLGYPWLSCFLFFFIYSSSTTSGSTDARWSLALLTLLCSSTSSILSLHIGRSILPVHFQWLLPDDRGDTPLKREEVRPRKHKPVYITLTFSPNRSSLCVGSAASGR